TTRSRNKKNERFMAMMSPRRVADATLGARLEASSARASLAYNHDVHHTRRLSGGSPAVAARRPRASIVGVLADSEQAAAGLAPERVERVQRAAEPLLGAQPVLVQGVHLSLHGPRKLAPALAVPPASPR